MKDQVMYFKHYEESINHIYYEKPNTHFKLNARLQPKSIYL